MAVVGEVFEDSFGGEAAGGEVGRVGALVIAIGAFDGDYFFIRRAYLFFGGIFLFEADAFGAAEAGRAVDVGAWIDLRVSVDE